MRFVSLTLFLAAALFAQAPPQNYQRSPVLTPEERARNIEKLRKDLQASKAVQVVTAGKTALAPGRACSIPLLNAMPRNAHAIDQPILIPTPPSSKAFAIRQIAPPAPPCADRDAQGAAAVPDAKAKP